MSREINLVPDIKGEMIRTLKFRNFIFFLCIVVAAASIGVTIIFGAIAGGQQTVISGKKSTIDNMHERLNSYADLKDFLTIKNQLSNINELTNDKKVLSRTFNILSAIIPTGADTIQISEMTVDLTEENPTFDFDAQANAGQEPYIDYNVLDSFKKSMQYMRYDYGNYVDKNGDTIPAYCMIENGADGATFKDADKGTYALWTIEVEGCNPAKDSESKNSSNENNTNSDYTTEEYDGKNVVRVWRTPQFNDWYHKNASTSQPNITTEGQISNVPHFESACITYTGHEGTNYTGNAEETIVTKTENMTWTSQNNECTLVPDGTESITISESSNGRNSSNELVLRFSASIVFNPEVFSFNNQHFVALAPSGRYNVTDSYVQIQAMFGQRAADCAENDTACSSENNNKSSSNTSTDNSKTNSKNGGN